jgi:hypothetical protein
MAFGGKPRRLYPIRLGVYQHWCVDDDAYRNADKV